MWKRLIAAGVVAAGIAVPLGATAATAATTTTAKPRDLSAQRHRCQKMIDARLAELTKLDNRVAKAKHLTDAHRQTITDINSHARAGLTDLRTKIDQDTDAAVLKTDCQSIVLDYRIFVLRAPQEHLTIASDAESAAVAKLRALEPKIEAAIDKAQSEGKDVSGAKQAFADLKDKVADAARQDDKVSDTVLAYTPADYNADHRILVPGRTAVKTAAMDLRAARDDAKTIARDLHRQSSTTTSAPSTTSTTAAP